MNIEDLKIKLNAIKENRVDQLKDKRKEVDEYLVNKIMVECSIVSGQSIKPDYMDSIEGLELEKKWEKLKNDMEDLTNEIEMLDGILYDPQNKLNDLHTIIEKDLKSKFPVY